MYTCVQPGCKKVNMATYVHTGGVSNAAHTYDQGSCTWLGRNGGNGMCHVHGEATECVMFMGRQRNASCSWGGNGVHRLHGEAMECIVFMGRQRNVLCSSGGNGTRGSQPAWMEQPMETRPGVPQNGGNNLVFDRPRSKWDPVHREGSGVPQNGGNGPPTVEMGVLLIGRGVAYRKT